MKRYIVVTNVWGKKWNIFHTGLKDYIKEEREEFDTIEEVNDYVNLFEGVYKDTNDKYTFKEPCEIWGYVVGDTNQFKLIKWGGTGMSHISKGVRGNCKRLVKPVPHSFKKEGFFGEMFDYAFHNFDSRMNNLYNKDYVFRGKDEIPANYRWDDGEYEGWLQFRWGDGTNAVGYVKENKSKKHDNIDEPIGELNDELIDEYHDEEIENSFLKEEDKEKLKRLIDRW